MAVFASRSIGGEIVPTAERPTVEELREHGFGRCSVCKWAGRVAARVLEMREQMEVTLRTFPAMGSEVVAQIRALDDALAAGDEGR